ncbi:MAG TPA: potassium transporter TrkA [Chloroflexi bacterium]|jgi:trk system potassium uptake protein TrkA|nr:potassium transporter TrkA [Chloroflexota bacterium]
MNILVIGCGRMGAELAQTLDRHGHGVTVVDSDPDAFGRLGPGFNGRTVVGIGFDRDVLLDAGIERADGLAAVTTSDEANLVAARLAQQIFRVPRIVARVYDPSKAEIYRRLGLQTISPVTWGVNRIAELLSFSPLSTVISLGGGAVDLVEVGVSPLLVGRTVNDVTVLGEVHVVAISRGGHTFLPTLGTGFREGDILHLAVMATSVERLRSILGTM